MLKINPNSGKCRHLTRSNGVLCYRSTYTYLYIKVKRNILGWRAPCQHKKGFMLVILGKTNACRWSSYVIQADKARECAALVFSFHQWIFPFLSFFLLLCSSLKRRVYFSRQGKTRQTIQIYRNTHIVTLLFRDLCFNPGWYFLELSKGHKYMLVGWEKQNSLFLSLCMFMSRWRKMSWFTFCKTEWKGGFENWNG